MRTNSINAPQVEFRAIVPKFQPRVPGGCEGWRNPVCPCRFRPAVPTHSTPMNTAQCSLRTIRPPLPPPPHYRCNVVLVSGCSCRAGDVVIFCRPLQCGGRRLGTDRLSTCGQPARGTACLWLVTQTCGKSFVKSGGEQRKRGGDGNNNFESSSLQKI